MATLLQAQRPSEHSEVTSVVMRKNEHNQQYLDNSETPRQKPGSLELELDQEQDQVSGFWTHRSSVISVADSAR